MKVAVSAMAPDMNAAIDPRFGRAQYFLIVDPDTMKFDVVPNPNIDAMGGAGIQSAQMIGNKGVEAIITGQVGPNAFQTLSAIGIRIHQSMGGTVRQAIEAFKAGQLPMVSQPGPGHAGMGMGGGVVPGQAAMGMGRAGRAGAGRGRWGGMGQGFRSWQAGPGFVASPRQTQSAPSQVSEEEETQALKQQAEMLGRQLEEINRRLEELETRGKGKK